MPSPEALRIRLISARFRIEYLKSFSLREARDDEGGLGKGPTVARRQSGVGGRRSAAGSQRYSRKSNEREPNEAILKGDIVGSLARRTNSITSSGIERRKRGSGTVYSGHRHEVDSTAGTDSLQISTLFLPTNFIGESSQRFFRQIVKARRQKSERNVSLTKIFITYSKILDSFPSFVKLKIKIHLTQLLHIVIKANRTHVVN